MPTWDMFRAVAARLGLSREQAEAVERGGEPTYVQHPLRPDVQIRVRPNPDWTQRMSDAWNGVLVNSRRECAGAIPIQDGCLFVGDSGSVDSPASPERGVALDVAPGDYEVVLTVAHEGAEQNGDYAEHVSHAFAVQRDNDGVAAIEPMTADDGTELWLDTGSLLFGGSGVLERLAAEHPETGIWQIVNLPVPSVPATMGPGRTWKRIATSDGTGTLITVRAGYARGSYPLFRMTDRDGRTVGVLVDFFVDNRPHDA